MKKETLYRYLWSSLITFLTGFGIAVLPEWSNLTSWTVIQDGTLWGVILIGARAGVKFCIESFIKWYRNRPVKDSSNIDAI